MFGDFNKVFLMGNVTNDPDLRFTPSGSGVLNFSLATNRRYKKGEEWVDEVSFHNIVVWRSSETLAQRIKKGTRVFIEGRIQTRSWENSEGQKQYKTEVIADDVNLVARYEGANDSSSPASGSQKPATKADSKSKNVEASEEPSGNESQSIDPDDLPF